MDATTIKVKRTTKDKLDKYKKNNNTYDDIILQLLKGNEGTELNDVTEIKRPKVAFIVEYEGYTDSGSICENNELQVTFKQLAESKVGDKFAPEWGNYMYYLFDEAEVIFKDNKSVFVRVTTEIITEEKETEEYELLHIHLF